MPSTSRSSWTWKGYRRLQIFLWCLPLAGLAFIFSTVRDKYQDRRSLEWPSVSGTVMHCEEQYGYGYQGRRGHYEVGISYRYQVNGQRYVGNRISLWNPNGSGPRSEVDASVAAYPAHSAVAVYYDPQHPENAVLEPGAEEEALRVLTWAGGIIVAALFYLAYRSNRFFKKLVAWRKANPPKVLPTRPKLQALPHAFVSYEPGCKRKLNCIPDKDALDQFLGSDDDKALQAWTPDDRIIDAKGQEYRLVPNTDKTRYNLEPTSQTWTAEKLLEVAVADARLLKKDDDALRRRVMAVPEEKRMPVLMKCIDDLPAGPTWTIVALILFLVLFFFAVIFAVWGVFALIGYWMAHQRH